MLPLGYPVYRAKKCSIDSVDVGTASIWSTLRFNAAAPAAGIGVISAYGAKCCGRRTPSAVEPKSLYASRRPGTHLAAFSSVDIRSGIPPSSALRCTHLNDAKRKGT